MLHKFLIVILLSIPFSLSQACDCDESNLVPTTPREERLDSVESAVGGVTLTSSDECKKDKCRKDGNTK